MADHTASDLFPYPRGYVIGILTDDATFAAARGRLDEEDLPAEVLHGEEGLARIDVAGEAHGTKGTIMRRLQSALGDDGDHLQRYVDHLRDGHYLVGVKVDEDEAAKQRAADALRDADDLNYYAENYVEDLRA